MTGNEIVNANGTGIEIGIGSEIGIGMREIGMLIVNASGIGIGITISGIIVQRGDLGGGSSNAYLVCLFFHYSFSFLLSPLAN